MTYPSENMTWTTGDNFIPTHQVIIEIPSFTSIKYQSRLNEDSHVYFSVDRRLPVFNPVNYGHIPGLYETNGDGDPLDVFLISRNSYFVGERKPISALTYVGQIRITDTGEKDTKVIFTDDTLDLTQFEALQYVLYNLSLIKSYLGIYKFKNEMNRIRIDSVALATDFQDRIGRFDDLGSYLSKILSA